MNYYAVLTDHGAQLIEQAYQHGQVVTITQMAIGDGGGVELEPAPSALAVAGEFDRVPLTSGASASSMLGGGVDYESTTHVGKWIRTLGLMDAQGNLIVYSNYPPTYIADKGSTLFRTLGLNIQLPIVHGDAVTVIVERPPYPPATETEYGVVKLATQAQTDAGAADDVVVTPKKLKAWVKQATETVPGMLKVATQAQTDSGSADDVVVTPKKLRAHLKANGFTAYGSALIGVPIDWPLAQMPQDIWPDCGMVFLSCAGQSFNKTTYPIAAQLYPSGVMPEIRGEFVRAWDNGRGVDAGRALLSAQAATQLPSVYTYASSATNGVLVTPPINSYQGSYPIDKTATDYENQTTGSGAYYTTAQQLTPYGNVSLSTFRVRSRSVAFHKIMRVG